MPFEDDAGMTSYPDGIPPAICDKFERLAIDVANIGYGRYSADSILHRLRWHYHIEKGDRAFKCNNNWTAPLARWFLARHPELPKFFELRERTCAEAQWKDDDEDQSLKQTPPGGNR